ncbi:hypothetical protein J3E74DRAFT_412141 [Bipolaris maydis]|nr:hypothetical protein J3E74DRAFT_412399 [Bipolaris maydis]KAJ5052641.1 hypothetical protein J3E74DRAFT_412141 [Bipolaris maydis]
MPDECRDEAKVDHHPSHSYMQFFLMRNNSYINKYNGLTSMARQVNTGIAPCISTAAVIENTLSTDLEDVSYFTFLCSHAHRALYNVRRRAKNRIINYFLQYARENVEDYGWAKLMLHHPFRTLQDVFFLPEIHDEPCDAYMEACEMSRERCTYPHDRFNDPLPNPEPSTHEDTQEDLDEEALSNMDAEWGELARQLPDSNGNNVDLLGCRAEHNVD